MLTQLTVLDPEAVRRRYKVVRRDLMTDMPGLIVEADEASGRCALLDEASPMSPCQGAVAEYDFGAAGLRIVPTGARRGDLKP